MRAAMKATRGAGGIALGAALTVLIASFAALEAQRSGPPAPPAPGTPPKPLVPVAASTLAANPDAFYGEYVSLMGTIEQSLSPLAFAVDQGKATPASKDVLVLAPRLNSPIDLHTYVTVVGEVVRFDPDEIARKGKDYTMDLSPELVAKYRGRPVVLATAVINSKMVDLAKRLPPPMSADEQAFDNVMKKVGPAFAALRQGLDGSNADAAKQNTAVLKQAFADAEAFWKTRGKADATQWAQDARKQVDLIERSATEGNWDAAKAPAGSLGQACQTCHAAYRERFDDGSYRIKTGTK